MQINSINVQKYSISHIFGLDVTIPFEIPRYQREYVWGMREWSALYEDLSENTEGYFLGSLICINSSSTPLSLKFEVVDGQQRLTTISILYAALYSILKPISKELDIYQQASFVHIEQNLVDKNKKVRLCLQEQGDNRKDYEALLSELSLIPPHTIPSYAGLRRIWKCFYYFKKHLVEDSAQDKEFLFHFIDKINNAILY